MDVEIPVWQLEVRDWLEAEAQRRHIRARFYMKLARTESGWLHVPVRIEGNLDAYDVATQLQALEDAWNDQEPQPDRQLLLIPAAN